MGYAEQEPALIVVHVFKVTVLTPDNGSTNTGNHGLTGEQAKWLWVKRSAVQAGNRTFPVDDVASKTRSSAAGQPA